MPDFISITSKDNKLLKVVYALQNSSKTRDENGLFVLEGLRICYDAFENGIDFKKLIVSVTAKEKYYDDILKFSSKADELYCIPDSLFNKISDTKSPQGIIAVCEIPQNKTTLDVKGRYIALENIQDPSNLGAISRTAEALGVSGLIIAGGCDAFAPKSLRASMGTLLRMPIFKIDSISEIKSFGLTTYACVVDKDAKKITETEFQDGSVVVIGNEANGITEETKSICDYNITIPMNGKAESLNAAVAASIAMWEMIKC
jgi:TrmH family RNA methyltransferase